MVLKFYNELTQNPTFEYFANFAQQFSNKICFTVLYTKVFTVVKCVFDDSLSGL